MLAWGLLLGASLTGQLVWLDHDYLLKESGLSWYLVLPVFLVAWLIMLGAMMFPVILPILGNSFPDTLCLRMLWKRQAGFLVGYSASWTLFACIALVGDFGVHQLVERWWWLYTHSWLILVSLLLLAGLYQLSTWKRRFLSGCCRFQELQGHSLRAGLSYGYVCVASCWPLMLLLFATGMQQLLVMGLFTVLMLCERELQQRHLVCLVSGGVLLALAVGLGIYLGIYNALASV
uniref:Metal-binding protein n=1 Tax=Thermosporothrix sp. COM3 TaxID=2490863 RepID=A0A455STC6_9CHLR|nr:hypothetical protein KTC_57110 [Thermosporothrix sp. COM3]